jgi:hypothetical protein
VILTLEPERSGGWPTLWFLIFLTLTLEAAAPSFAIFKGWESVLPAQESGGKDRIKSSRDREQCIPPFPKPGKDGAAAFVVRAEKSKGGPGPQYVMTFLYLRFAVAPGRVALDKSEGLVRAHFPRAMRIGHSFGDSRRLSRDARAFGGSAYKEEWRS